MDCNGVFVFMVQRNGRTPTGVMKVPTQIAHILVMCVHLGAKMFTSL